MDVIKQMIAVETERTRAIQSSEALQAFASTPTYWELLLTIYKLDGDPNFGVNDYVDLLTVQELTRLTVLNFMKAQLKAGHLQLAPSLKRSRKTLILSDALKVELLTFCEKYWRAWMQHGATRH